MLSKSTKSRRITILNKIKILHSKDLIIERDVKIASLCLRLLDFAINGHLEVLRSQLRFRDAVCF